MGYSVKEQKLGCIIVSNQPSLPRGQAFNCCLLTFTNIPLTLGFMPIGNLIRPLSVLHLSIWAPLYQLLTQKIPKIAKANRVRPSFYLPRNEAFVLPRSPSLAHKNIHPKNSLIRCRFVLLSPYLRRHSLTFFLGFRQRHELNLYVRFAICSFLGNSV